MLAQVVVLFALVSAVLSTKNLREEPAAAAVPVDNKRGEAAYKSMLKRNLARANSHASPVQERTDAVAVNDKSAVPAHEKKSSLGAGPWPPVEGAYVVFRQRPNADCSGVSTFLSAERVYKSCRLADNEGSYEVSGCMQAGADGLVRQVVGHFHTPDCSGEPAFVEDQPMGNQCSFNQNTPRRPPATARDPSASSCRRSVPASCTWSTTTRSAWSTGPPATPTRP